MDSQDSSAPPPHHHHHHHHHPHHPHHPQPPFSAHHHHPMMMGHPHTQIQPQHPSSNSYLMSNNNNSIVPTTSATSNSSMMHQQQQNPRFPFNSMAPASAAAAAQKPLDHQFSDGSPSGSAGGWFSAEPARKKRGRPRKYSPDNSIGLGLSPAPVAQISPAGGHVDPSGGVGTASSETPVKRHRGRPPGSVKKQLDALGIPGIGFTPHVITINSGEDIAAKIMAFAQQGPRTVCILSANGAICNLALRQPGAVGGAVQYEGRFEIISLSGSFPTSDSNGSQSGVLSISVARSDGSVLGGGVVGTLHAASPVQVVVGSFIAEGKKPKVGGSSVTPSNMLNFGTPGTRASPPSAGGGSSDSGDDNEDSPPLAPAASGPYANVGGHGGHPVHSVPIFPNTGWANNSIKM